MVNVPLAWMLTLSPVTMPSYVPSGAPATGVTVAPVTVNVTERVPSPFDGRVNVLPPPSAARAGGVGRAVAVRADAIGPPSTATSVRHAAVQRMERERKAVAMTVTSVFDRHLQGTKHVGTTTEQ